jgi:hypothetical protein
MAGAVKSMGRFLLRALRNLPGPIGSTGWVLSSRSFRRYFHLFSRALIEDGRR